MWWLAEPEDDPEPVMIPALPAQRCPICGGELEVMAQAVGQLIFAFGQGVVDFNEPDFFSGRLDITGIACARCGHPVEREVRPSGYTTGVTLNAPAK
jgi:endogenous inhibitor of DNA gyrase (YacG/DUF329 family)